MFLAMAVLLIHPQIAAAAPRFVDKAALDIPAAISRSTGGIDAETFSATASDATESASSDAGTTLESGMSAALPEAPAPVSASFTATAPAPRAFLKPAQPGIISVQQLQAENRRKQMAWRGLAIASSGAATFDAWSTRRAITNSGAQELNPLLKPFAGNSSLYAAIQVAPVLLDLAGKKMMYSKHSWMRRAWWVPQSASFVSSMFCGAHNLAFH